MRNPTRLSLVLSARLLAACSTVNDGEQEASTEGGKSECEGEGEGEGEGEQSDEFIEGCPVTSLDLRACSDEVPERLLLQADCVNGDRYEVLFGGSGLFEPFTCERNGLLFSDFQNEGLCALNPEHELDRRQIIIRMRAGCNLD